MSSIKRTTPNKLGAMRRTAVLVAALTTAFGAAAMGEGASNTAMTQTAASAPATGMTLSKSDTKWVDTAAQGGMSEVALGKVAQTNAMSDQVKQFGQKMVDDHSKADSQLASIASSKGVTVPTTLDKSHQKDVDKLSKMTGVDFDKKYMAMMVSDHKKDISDFQKAAKSAKDADIKSFASTTLPTLQEHLQMAQAANDVAKGEKK